MKSKLSCLPVSLYAEFYNGTRTVPQWSAQGKMLGLDTVDINALFLKGKTEAEIGQIRAELEIPVFMVSAYSDFTHPSRETRQEVLDTALTDIRAAQQIGATWIRLTAGQAYPGETDAAMIDRAYAGFAVCAEAAEKAGVGILLENHSRPGAWKYPDFDFHLERFAALWDRLRELPVSVNFDTANAYALGDWKAILNGVAGRIATVHLNDLSSVSPLGFARIGAGIVPLEEMLRTVYATGFSGAVCMEEAGFQNWEGVVKAAAYAKELLRQCESAPL